MTAPLDVSVAVERFPIAGTFTISRGSRTEAVVVTVTISDGRVAGRGECVPYARYGETVEGVVEAIERMAPDVATGRVDLANLAGAMPAGAARNALDCALWDWRAKASGIPAAETAGVAPLKPLVTAYTLSLGTPDSMAEAAAAAAHRPLLKVKLGGEGDAARIRAVRAAAPASTLVVDANEAWSPEIFAGNMAACVEAGVALIEQPLPAGADAALAGMPRPIPICADESLHGPADLASLRDRYDAVNIKLDKAGGLTTALEIAAGARALGFQVMLGCMVGTSLAMAPAVLVAQWADFVDLDGPLLLARDRNPGLVYEGSTLLPPTPDLWG
ncbi:N-acetyl-D-Glu racemase DgcA [Prosthecomicrobium sp. N25]|uniref:N-acetyl-D-Glu racemase DgcA n=1 Tax=Prosthecomicrobium sp. N25 TaxID=3129254 RepID=UPI0030781D49